MIRNPPWLMGLLMLSMSIAAHGANVTFVGAGGVVPYTTASNWDTNSLPGRSDDAVVKGRFTLNDGSTQNVNSLEVNGGGSFIQNGTLNVTNDIDLNSGLEVQGKGNLTWGGLATIGDATRTDVFSLVNPVEDKAVGKDLTVAADGLLRFRFFAFPAGMPGNTTPVINLSGDLTFTAGSELEVKLEGALKGAPIALGSYLLIDGARFTGALPKLILTNFDAGQNGQFVLQKHQNGIYLTSAELKQ